jgi:hypothetical protein
MLARIAFASLLILASAAPTHAAFVVSIGNATPNAGDTITLDVTISGQDRLDYVFAEFVLVSLDGSSPAGKVHFVVDGFGKPPLPPLSDPNYVFPLGNSFAIDNLPSNPASVYDTNWTGDTYLTSDATLDLAGVDVSGGKLLTRLTVKVDGSTPGGSRYGVTYGTNSVYLNQFGEEIPVTLNGGEIAVLSGVVAVPTPSGMVLMAAGTLIVLFSRWNRRRWYGQAGI